MKPADIELSTERLHLARIAEEDAGLMLAVWNDPDFIRFVGDRGVRTLNESLETLRGGAMKHWEEHGYGPYSVALSAGRVPIGICSLLLRENLDDPDIGYGFLPQYCGKGYAFEAAAAVLQHVREHMKLPRIKAIVSPDNKRSLHLLDKLGLKVEGPIRMPDEEEEILLYGLDFEENA